jgi:hypothetical protein
VSCAIDQKEDIIIPKIFFHGTRRIQTAGGKFINYKGASHSIGNGEMDSELYNNEGYFEYAPTCFMLISKKVFETVGLVDENYFVYYDDNDFTYRTTKNGFRIYYLPELEIFHKVSYSTGGADSMFRFYYTNRNKIYFIKKNFSFPLKQVALGHAVIGKALKFFFVYNKDRKQTLIRAFKDGFSMKANY